MKQASIRETVTMRGKRIAMGLAPNAKGKKTSFHQHALLLTW